MMEYKEEDYLLLSGIQHFVFCTRQWALIHIEKEWKENIYTVVGENIHKNAHDKNKRERRGNILIVRALPIFSKKLGISGECDVVEFHKNQKGINIFGEEGLWIPIPIEYKKGKPKINDEDILQLVAQSICLEEMLLCEIKFGYLYYNETKHREKIEISDEEREKVNKICIEMHDLYKKGYTPKVKTSKKCYSCSLKDICIPKLCSNISATKYIDRSIKE